VRLPGLALQDALLNASRTFAFLAPLAFPCITSGLAQRLLPLFDFGQEQLPGPRAVPRLGSFGFTTHPQSGRPVNQHHGGGSFVDVLPARPAGTDKYFFNIRLAHPQSRLPPLSLRFLI